MNDFNIENHSFNPAPFAASTPEPAPLQIEAPVEAGVRIVPVEDLGLGLVRLFQGGVSGIVALGKGDALANAVKKSTSEINGVLNKAVHTVTGLVNRASAAKE